MAKLSLPAEAALCGESSSFQRPTKFRRQLVLPNKFLPPSNLSPLEDEFDGEASHHLREIEKDRKRWRAGIRTNPKETSDPMISNGES
jgi:hypothetical protein